MALKNKQKKHTSENGQVEGLDWKGPTNVLKNWKTIAQDHYFFYFIFLIKRMSGSLDAKYEEMGGESEQCAKHVFTKDSNM